MKAVTAAAVVAAATVIAAVPAQAGAATSSTRAVFLFPSSTTTTLTQVAGASSTVVRNAGGATLTLRTSELLAGDAVTVWWVVFNNPSACTSGHFGLHCGPGDLGRPQTGASVLYAAGHVIGSSGVGDFGGRLRVGDTSGALFGPGLTNPAGADIHLVVHDHGPADPALLPDEIHSFGVCNTTCHDVQVSVHEA